MASGLGSGRPAPLKPWERAASTSTGPSPFSPASNKTSTASVVETSVTTTQKNAAGVGTNPAVAGATVGRPMPPRPWEQDYTSGRYGTSSLTGYNQGGYGSTSYGTGLGTGLYGSSYGSGYGGYGRSGMYGGGYGGSMYGSGYGSSYGNGMYGSRYGGGGYGGGYGGYGMSGMGGGYGAMGPYNPNGPNGEEPPPRPPGLWLTLLQGLAGAMHFFGRISMLVDENTQALHMFITALLQLFDRSGILYGELARFVLRLLGFRSAKTRARSKAGARALEGAVPQHGQHGPPAPGQNMAEKPPAPEREWDSVWTD